MNRLELAALERAMRAFVELNPELKDDEQLRADCLEGELDIDKALARFVAKEREADALATACKAQEDDLSMRRERFTKRSKAFRYMIESVLSAGNLQKFELPQATLSMVSGRPKVNIYNEAQIPAHLIRVKREPDKQSIGAELIAGRPVPGATLTNGAPTLQIRTR